jgi:hypothetical protein
MSKSSRHTSSDAPIRHLQVRLNEDVVPPYIFALIFATVVIILFGIGWSWLIYHDQSAALGGFPKPLQLEQAPREISGINQTLILHDRYGQRLRQQQTERLEGFGWIDRDKGIVHIPIDEAMRVVIQKSGSQP